MLLKRSSQAPFNGIFEIRVQAGTTHDFDHRLKRFFGADPGKSKPFLLTPSPQPRVRYEGKDILANVDPKNLAKLKKKGKPVGLSIVWGLDPVD